MCLSSKQVYKLIVMLKRLWGNFSWPGNLRVQENAYHNRYVVILIAKKIEAAYQCATKGRSKSWEAKVIIFMNLKVANIC